MLRLSTNSTSHFALLLWKELKIKWNLLLRINGRGFLTRILNMSFWHIWVLNPTKDYDRIMLQTSINFDSSCLPI